MRQTPLLITFMWLCGLWLAMAPAVAGAASILRTDIQQLPQREVVVFHADAPLQLVKSFTLSNPSRLVVDISKQDSGAGAVLDAGYRGGQIAAIRFGQPTPDVSRIVLDLAAIPSSYRTYLNPTATQLVIELPPSSGAALPAPVAQPFTPPAAPASIPPQAPTHTQPPLKAVGSVDYWQGKQEPATAPTPAPKPLMEVRAASKPVIVIDAGHGGKDIGATGLSGIHEKDVTLRYAMALRQALLRTGRYQVVLTREDDVYLFLKERVDIARKHKGSLFISIHADSNPNPKAQGLSVYTISEQASDAESAALAAQENKSDVIGGIDLSVEDEKVANILIDLAQRETRNKASAFAEALIDVMHPKVPLLTNTHRFAGFRVLKAPDIPSVLVEIGFLSNREDEARIQSEEYQDKVVRSLLSALDTYYVRQ